MGLLGKLFGGGSSHPVASDVTLPEQHIHRWHKGGEIGEVRRENMFRITVFGQNLRFVISGVSELLGKNSGKNLYYRLENDGQWIEVSPSEVAILKGISQITFRISSTSL